VSSKHILKTIEFKLYLNEQQEVTLNEWLRVCCWTYNQALEHRIKAYKRRGESFSYNTQSVLLTGLRERIEQLKAVPRVFLNDSIRRVDLSFKAFFRRLKEGSNSLGFPGFPRFHSHRRYNSLEYLAVGNYIGNNRIRIPKLGKVQARGQFDVVGEQRLLRIIRRTSGWYAQVVIDTGIPVPPKIEVKNTIGIDVGLESFLTTSDGDKVANPRYLRRSERKLKQAHRRVSRCRKGSNNRRKAMRRLTRQHERVKAQRRDFCHQESRKLVDRFDLIGLEKLNIKGMSAGILAKSVNDAAWGLFFRFVLSKAECAGKHAIAVDSRGTSQTCPDCGAVKKKELCERVHACSCGLVIDRDHAAARVILSRALGVAGVCGGTGRCTAPDGSISRPDETGSP
jgi:putative transposase